MYELLIPMMITGAVRFSSGLFGYFLFTRQTTAAEVPL